MKIKLLKRINKKIRLVEVNGMFEVQYKPFGSDIWELLNLYSSIEKAIKKKNNYIIMIILRDLGYRSKLAKRRNKRKNNKLN